MLVIYICHLTYFMKKILVLAFVLSAVFLACNKKSDPCDYDPCAFKAPDSEIQSVRAYIDGNSITATQHCSGVFYRIENQGTGNQPSACSAVSVKYKGYLTNGTVFETTTSPVTFDLRNLILGWVNTIPLIKAGGRIVVYIPPTLGYGNRAQGPIPANSILIFEIDLVSA